MRYLVDVLGLKIVAAYGNTSTDVKAYAEAGIPKEVRFEFFRFCRRFTQFYMHFLIFVSVDHHHGPSWR